MRKASLLVVLLTVTVSIGIVFAALIVPTDIQQPGTQPQEVSNLESPDKCDNCHGGYDQSVEPAHNWRGSMMANAGRDPIFWATLAVAEQDFDGAGDLCIRCHSTAGWLGGRSTPTDGSGLVAGDADGVECDFCHKMTNPNDSEHLGVMNPPFIANDGAGNGYYGSGMASIWGSADKLGPYVDAEARHQFMQSQFHRTNDFCGSCHDVSNPAVGDLAHNNGAQATADPVISSGAPGSPVEGKASFNNFPFMYGIVERTFSEFMSSEYSRVSMADLSLPEDIKSGAILAAYESALATGPTGPDYADTTERFLNCQTCHMHPVTGFGCNKKGAPVRTDLPLHDMTGGNYWMPDAIQYLDLQGKLLLGGGLTATQIAAINDGKTRVLKQLNEAASLEVIGDTLKIVNFTGHKLISGYPEGRRMWLNVKWYDRDDVLLREDGEYGSIGVTINHPFDGTPYNIESILDLNDTNTKIYEAHYAMTQEWADQLINLGYSPTLPLSYDRVTGLPDYSLGELAAQGSGTYQETFHFVLNNKVAKDNRIPPYGLQYDEARKRNALPVPADQYGNPGPGGVYNYFDSVSLDPPANAVYATIGLLYQPTSWEYIQFLWKANSGQNPFLADEGANLLAAWLGTGMAHPYIMASTTWSTAPTPPINDVLLDFGSGTGIWVRYNDATWSKLHSLNPEIVVTGDLDGNGQDDCIIDFGSGIGLYILYNNSTWTKLHSASAEIIATGDLDGIGEDEVIIDFGSGTGIWIRYNNVAWTKLHSLSPEIIITGDLDGNGKDDCIVDFGSGIGVYVYYNNATWAKLHSSSPEIMAIGDLDGTGQDDCIMDFGAGVGTYVRYNNTTWAKLHNSSPEIVATGDLDGNGQDDCIMDFGAGTGLWVRYNNATWSKLHNLNPEIIETGDLDSNGQDDVIIDFGSGIGTYVWYNNATWTKLHNLSAESITTGNLDNN